MLACIIGLAAVVILAVWLHGLVNWDGKKGCRPEDCDMCPFPRCEDRPINKMKGRTKNMINWKVRIKNKNFWLTVIPALLLLIQVVASVFGFTLDLGDLGGKLLAVVNAVFAVLTILGIVTDPTTEGVSDSTLAMTYEEPKKKN